MKKMLLKIDAIWRANSSKLVRKHSTWLKLVKVTCHVFVPLHCHEKMSRNCIYKFKHVEIISSKNATNVTNVILILKWYDCNYLFRNKHN